MKPPLPFAALVSRSPGCFWHRFDRWCIAAWEVGHCDPAELHAGPVLASGAGGWITGDVLPPLTPIPPLPRDEPAPRPPSRRWEYPFSDPCKGEFRLPLATPPQAGTGIGDYAGDGWMPLGITGYEVRVFVPAIPGASPGPVLQYRLRQEGSASG